MAFPSMDVNDGCHFFLFFFRCPSLLSAAAAKSLQSCPTLFDSIDGSPPGPPISGILQARTLEWVAISFSNAWKWKVTVKSLSHVRLLVTPWTAAYQVPPFMGFSRQSTAVGCHCLILLIPKWDNSFKGDKKNRQRDQECQLQGHFITLKN